MSHDYRKVYWEPTEHTKSNTDTTNRQTDNKRKVATDNALNLTCRVFTEPAASPARNRAPDLIWASATLARVLRALIS